MTETDLILIYKRFEEIDRELKLLKAEVADMKWYQQHGTSGAVAYSATQPKKQWVPQWEENLSDNEKFDGDFK